MRIHLDKLLLLLATGCTPVSAGIGAAAELASIPVLGRSLPDAVISVVAGQDCSVVRIDQGNTYCRPPEPPPPGIPFCTRSLGVVDCWVDPWNLNGPPPRPVADGARMLTPAQQINARHSWP